MIKDLMQSVKSFLSEKQAVAQKERQLIEDLNRVLPEIGYRVVPTANAERQTTSAARAEEASASRADARKRAENGGSNRKPLACQYCDRRFARPLHLGRHMAASHSKKKRAA